MLKYFYGFNFIFINNDKLTSFSHTSFPSCLHYITKLKLTKSFLLLLLQITTFSDRPGYLRISSSLWKQREEYCASLIQKAWKFHKLRNTETHTEEPHTGDEDDANSSCGGQGSSDVDKPAETVPGGPLRLPPINVESKHLIEVRSAEDSAD